MDLVLLPLLPFLLCSLLKLFEPQFRNTDNGAAGPSYPITGWGVLKTVPVLSGGVELHLIAGGVTQHGVQVSGVLVQDLVKPGRG